MAKIKTLTNRDGEVFYPLTHTDAVLDNQGRSVSTRFSEMEESTNEKLSEAEAEINAKITELEKSKVDKDSIAQETGNSENAVMSQAAVTEKLTELGSILGKEYNIKSDVNKAGYSYPFLCNLKQGETYKLTLKGNGVINSGVNMPLYHSLATSTNLITNAFADGDSINYSPTTDITSLHIYVGTSAFANAGTVEIAVQQQGGIIDDINDLSKGIDTLQEDANSLNNHFFIGKDTSISTVDITSHLINGSRYRISLKSTTWSTHANTSTSSYVFIVETKVAGKSSILVGVPYGSLVKDYYDITVPQDAEVITIGGRASNGVKVYYNLERLDDIEKLDSRLNELTNRLIGATYSRTKDVKQNSQDITVFVGALEHGTSVELNVIDTNNTIIEGGSVLLYERTEGDESINIGSYTTNTKFVYKTQGVSKTSSFYLYCQQSQLSDMTVGSALTLEVKVLPSNASDIDGDKILANSFTSAYNAEDIEAKCREFAELFKSTDGEVEPFIFFTDPHLLTSSVSDIEMKRSISLIQKYYNSTATNFVMCGGDWINSDVQKDALYKLSYIDGFMNKLFKRYYPIYGNHDNNYQGKLTEDSEANTGSLSDQSVINLMFRKWSKKYYSFLGTSTRFYILDTGTDWNTKMNDYRWAQIDWLANELKKNDDGHNAVGMHIVCNQGTLAQWDTYITEMAENVTEVMNAYNNRGIVTINGKEYNYSGCKGKCHCIICGHTHYDNIANLNNIPIYCTTQFKKNYTGETTFDLVVIDYGLNKLKSIRVGAGKNREMDLA